MIELTLKNFLSLEDLELYAAQKTSVKLSENPELKAFIETNHRFFLEKIEKGWPVYGAVTGFGSSSASRISQEATARLQKNLYRYHGCGVGEAFDEKCSAAIYLVRLNCLLQGASGVSYELLERLSLLLRERIYAEIPSRGSVGASGDLTPLSYIAAALAGERTLWFRNERKPAREVWQELGLEPYNFKAREALAIMNGTSVMAALAGLSWIRLNRIYQVMAWSTAALVEIWQGQCSPFFAELHRVKPHDGQGQAAALIFDHLFDPRSRLLKKGSELEGAVQDPYSIRCSPQVIGAFKDALNVTRPWIETEINSVNDNPVFLHEDDLVLNGGHFLGQHITMASDLLKAALANLINLCDRQMALLMESKGRLPENLVSPKVSSAENHGFKAMQITLSALAAELSKAAMPMSAFSRPTEASNQDVVSMGTSSARELYELSLVASDAAAIYVMALVQSLNLVDVPLNPSLHEKLRGVRKVFPGIEEDCALDGAISLVHRTLFGENP